MAIRFSDTCTYIIMIGEKKKKRSIARIVREFFFVGAGSFIIIIIIIIFCCSLCDGTLSCAGARSCTESIGDNKNPSNLLSTESAGGRSRVNK